VLLKGKGKINLEIFPADLTPLKKRSLQMPAPDPILSLIERFEFHRQAYIPGKYNETQLRREFVDKFFFALTPQKVTAKTASRDQKKLCDSGILAQTGTTGKGTHYILSSAYHPKEDIQRTYTRHPSYLSGHERYMDQPFFTSGVRTINFANPADIARHDRMVTLVTQVPDLNRKLQEARPGQREDDIIPADCGDGHADQYFGV